MHRGGEGGIGAQGQGHEESQGDSDQASGDTLHYAFGDELAHDVELSGANCAPDPDLALSAQGARRETYAAIYRLNGEELTLCFAAGTENRPRKFDAPAGSTARLYFLKRQGPEGAGKGDSGQAGAAKTTLPL